jgi:molecular chaperone HtpG
MLAGAGRLKTAGKPISEVNTQHDLVRALAALSDDDRAFKVDLAHLLFDDARVLDGDRPTDARMFCDRLARLMRRGLGTNEGYRS